MSKKEKGDKALLVQRFVAYIIDIMFISIIVSLVSTPFTDSEMINTLQEQTVEMIEQYGNQEITVKDYLSQYTSLYYKTAKAMGISTILSIFASVCYFVVYQVYANGQTFGKKLMKIRVKSDEGNLTYNQMIFRSFIADSILVDIICFVFMMVLNGSNYFYISSVFQVVQFIVTFISVIMIITSEKGCAVHDRITHTTVIREK